MKKSRPLVKASGSGGTGPLPARAAMGAAGGQYSLLSDARKLTKREAGKLGMRARWGEPRVVRLDDLTDPQRRLVVALVDAARQEAAHATANGETVAVDQTRAVVKPERGSSKPRNGGVPSGSDSAAPKMTRAAT